MSHRKTTALGIVIIGGLFALSAADLIPLRLVSLFGIFGLIWVGWLFSLHRTHINWRTVGWGLVIQLIFALLVLKTAPGQKTFDYAAQGVKKLVSFADRGGEFVFGGLYRGMDGNYEGQSTDPKAPKKITYVLTEVPGGATPDASVTSKLITQGRPGQPTITVEPRPMGMVLFLNALMPIVFFSALMSVLYYLGVMNWIVAFMARGMHKLMGTSGSESLSASANIFVGQTEAPLVVKPFIDTMTMSEIHAVMTGGFATVAGGVLAAYIGFGIDPAHLLAASVMSAPAALVAAKLFLPETEESVTAGEMKIELEKTSVNVIDAACQGAADGMKLVLNVAAMLIAFIALIAMIDWILGACDRLVCLDLLDRQPIGLDLSWIFGKLFFPIAALIGIPWNECQDFGSLMGKRMALNEFLAYADLQSADYAHISDRTRVLATYAFCGFANFGSIAIQIGGIGAIAEGRKKDLAKLGLRAMFAGTLASLFTASLVGALLSQSQIQQKATTGPAKTGQIEQTHPAPQPTTMLDWNGSASHPEVGKTPPAHPGIRSSSMGVNPTRASLSNDGLDGHYVLELQ